MIDLRPVTLSIPKTTIIAPKRNEIVTKIVVQKFAMCDLILYNIHINRSVLVTMKGSMGGDRILLRDSSLTQNKSMTNDFPILYLKNINDCGSMNG